MNKGEGGMFKTQSFAKQIDKKCILHSTHIMCIHVGLGANQKLNNWQMTILGGLDERSVSLNENSVFRYNRHSTHSYTIATSNSNTMHAFKSRNCKYYIIAVNHIIGYGTHTAELCKITIINNLKQNHTTQRLTSQSEIRNNIFRNKKVQM